MGRFVLISISFLIVHPSLRSQSLKVIAHINDHITSSQMAYKNGMLYEKGIYIGITNFGKKYRSVALNKIRQRDKEFFSTSCLLILEGYWELSGKTYGIITNEERAYGYRIDVINNKENLSDVIIESLKRHYSNKKKFYKKTSIPLHIFEKIEAWDIDFLKTVDSSLSHPMIFVSTKICDYTNENPDSATIDFEEYKIN